MKRFACCPVCAHKLCKGEKGCYLDIKCPRCGEVIHIEIGDVITTRIVSKEEREKGASVVKAAVTGTKERFRAVLMTAFTFILGVFPMIVATGAGASSRIAIGVPVFYGMLVGTAAGLIVIPLLYVLFQTMREKTYELTRGKPEYEQFSAKKK